MKVVRCAGANKPTPYLAKWLPVMQKDGLPHGANAVDLACGNGRNSDELRRAGLRVLSLDQQPDYDLAREWFAGTRVPVPNRMTGVVLCQYLLMFLTRHDVEYVCQEINRIAAHNCILIIELQEVEAAQNNCDIEDVIDRLIGSRYIKFSGWYGRWHVVHQSKNRCVLQLRLRTKGGVKNGQE
jgi:hypothetical protein